MKRVAKSSIHIAQGHLAYIYHNARIGKTAHKNSIFDDEDNEISNILSDAKNIFEIELKKRTEAYTKRTKQKLQKNSITHLSAIVNLNKHHTLEDMEKVAHHLEQKFDTKVFQIAIHRDEGHIGENGEENKNYHAHLEFMGLDSDGASVRKKLTKKSLSQLQTSVADILGMERGHNYIREKLKRPKRLDTYEYKAHKEAEAVKQKELKEEMAKLRRELQEQGAKREDYARLEQINRELKKKAYTTEYEIKAITNEYSNPYFEEIEVKTSYKKLYEESMNEIDELKVKLQKATEPKKTISTQQTQKQGDPSPSRGI